MRGVRSSASPEAVFTYGAPQLKFGPGASAEIGYDLSQLGARRVLVVTDPGVAATAHPARITMSQPAGVTAAAGMDILCHALESYTARWYTTYERKRPEERVPYCGSNPVSDMWSEKALGLLARAFTTAVRDGGNRQARGDMALAATFAGLGFGNAGVHIPHACGYPIAGRARDFRPPDYPGQRLLATCPRPVTADDLAGIFSRSMELW
jgi:alcohol dehydrogenase class IV